MIEGLIDKATSYFSLTAVAGETLQVDTTTVATDLFNKIISIIQNNYSDYTVNDTNDVVTVNFGDTSVTFTRKDDGIYVTYSGHYYINDDILPYFGKERKIFPILSINDTISAKINFIPEYPTFGGSSSSLIEQAKGLYALIKQNQNSLSFGNTTTIDSFTYTGTDGTYTFSNVEINVPALSSKPGISFIGRIGASFYKRDAVLENTLKANTYSSFIENLTINITGNVQTPNSTDVISFTATLEIDVNISNELQLYAVKELIGDLTPFRDKKVATVTSIDGSSITVSGNFDVNPGEYICVYDNANLNYRLVTEVNYDSTTDTTSLSLNKDVFVTVGATCSNMQPLTTIGKLSQNSTATTGSISYKCTISEGDELGSFAGEDSVSLLDILIADTSGESIRALLGFTSWLSVDGVPVQDLIACGAPSLLSNDEDIYTLNQDFFGFVTVDEVLEKLADIGLCSTLIMKDNNGSFLGFYPFLLTKKGNNLTIFVNATEERNLDSSAYLAGLIKYDNDKDIGYYLLEDNVTISGKTFVFGG